MVKRPAPNEAPTETAASATVDLPRIRRDIVTVDIVGVSPLIVHAWSEKARRQMLEAMQTKTRAKKDPRDPLADYEASMYRLPKDEATGEEAHGFPAVGFKAAVINAVSLFDGITKVSAKQALFIHGEGPQQLVRINGEPEMREDSVRNQTGVADLRYRAQYWPWSATLKVEFVPSMLSVASVVSLIDAAGLGGVGEWRPSAPRSATGGYGKFQVAE